MGERERMGQGTESGDRKMRVEGWELETGVRGLLDNRPALN